MLGRLLTFDYCLQGLGSGHKSQIDSNHKGNFMIVRIFAACMLLNLASWKADGADHPLDIVPANVRGALVFPNLDSFKTNGDKLVAAIQGRAAGFDVSALMQMAGAELSVSGAADDTKPMGAFWFDGRLVEKEKITEFDAMAAAIPISDVERLAKNLMTDVEILKTGKTLQRDGSLGFKARFYRLVDGYLWISSHEGLFEYLLGKDRVTKSLPQSRLEVLKSCHAIAIFGSGSADDQVKWFLNENDQWLKENAEADEEEKRTIREVFELLTRATHASISLRVDEGLELDTDLYFKAEHEPEVRKLMERLKAGAASSTLAGLPSGNVLFSHASSANGKGSFPTLALVSRELNRHWSPSIKAFDAQGFLSQSQQLDFIGIFGEVWHQLDGYRVAVYRNQDAAEHGLTSVVAILDTQDPQAFLRDMRQLAGFLDETGLNPQGLDKPEVAAEAVIKQLIAELGDRDFRKRHSATTRLILIGERANSLVAQAKSSEIPEVARRAAMIETKIAEATKDKRNAAIEPSLISKAKPEFIFFPDRETRAGQSVHWVEIKTQANAELRAKLRSVFGPQWQQIRLVPMKDKVVVSIGSDTRLLDQTLANLKADQPGLASDSTNAVFKRELLEKRVAEFHMSPSRFVRLQGGTKIPVAKPDEKTYEQVSLAVTLQPKFLNIEWRIPQSEMIAIRKLSEF